MDPKKIIVHCPNPVGDFIMATPALKAIRNHYPQARISLLVKPALRELAEGAPWFDDIILYPNQKDRGNFLRYLTFVSKLRREAFDSAILFPNSFSSALIFWLGGAKQRVGYARDGRYLFLTDRIKPLKKNGRFIPQPMLDYYGTILTYLGINYQTKNLELYVTPLMHEKALTILQTQGVNLDRPLIAINPSAGFGSSKYWHSDYFAQVADTLIEQYLCQILLLPGPGEYFLAQEIKGFMRHKPVVIKGEEVSLGLLKALISHCNLFVTTDSGPRHIGVALDKPVVVVMGPTHHIYSDVGHSKTIVLREDIDCSPCHLKVCPTDQRCMQLITPEKVLNAIQTLYGVGCSDINIQER
jgi:heptosyltransferase-2